MTLEPLNMHGTAATWEDELFTTVLERDEARAENERLRALLAGSEAPPVAQGAAENGGQGNLSPGGASHSIMAVARHMDQDNQRAAEMAYLKVQLDEERAAFHAEQVAGREARDQIEELLTALEQTASVLHHEAHSVYTDWRICDDSRCRRAAELV